MRFRLMPFLCLLLLAASPAAEAAKKKGSGKDEAAPFGPVRTVAAQGNPATGTPLGTEPSSATATCPKGTKVVGGGFLTPAAPNVLMAIEQSFRSSPRSWTVVGNAIAGTSAVTAYGYCRKTPGKIKEVITSTFTGGFFLAEGSASVACPRNTRVISGGFELTRGPGPADLATARASISSGNSWLVSAWSATEAPQGVIVYGYCAEEARTKAKRRTVSGVVPIDGAGSVASRGCPKPKRGQRRKRMGTGGFSSSLPTTETAIMLITESRLANRRWQVAALNVSGESGTGSVTAAGVCF
jgi:hypothetical protein